jgi:hypothetical protein
MSDIELNAQEQYRRQNVRFQCVQLACKVPDIGAQEIVDLAADMELFIFDGADDAVQRAAD